MPMEPTEEIPFLAFEYAWKVVNRLYNSLSIPKVRDQKTGKTRDANAKESTLYLFEKYDATSAIIEANKKKIQELCDCVLEVSDRAKILGKRVYVVFEEAPPEEAMELRKSAIEKCERLARAVDVGNQRDASEALVESLLSVRNARVHAAVDNPKEKSPPGGELVDSTRTERKQKGIKHIDLASGGTIQSVRREDYEIHTVAEIALSIGKILISKKTSQALDEITDLVDSRTSQLVIAIYERVQEWGPKRGLMNEGKPMKKQARNHVNRKLSGSDGAPAKLTGAVSGEFDTEMFEYDRGRQVTVYVPPDPPEANRLRR